MKLTTSLTTIFALVLGFATTHAADKKEVKPYPLTTCAVSGEKLGGMGKPAELEQDGYQMKFCCKDCIKDFQKDPAKYIAKVKKAYKDAKPYPIDTCLVSGEKFEMGEPFVFVYDGRQFRTCCKNCLKDFNKDPDKFVKKWDEAAATAKAGQN